MSGYLARLKVLLAEERQIEQPPEPSKGRSGGSEGGRRACVPGTAAAGDAVESWMQALAGLDPARPPCNVPAKRWEQFLNDGRRFLEHGWAVRAITLGWGPHDLFGCDRVKPYARVDRLGLVWLLDGRPIAALTAETARISTASGGHLTFRRRPIEPDLALAWTLPANDNRSVIGKKIDPGNLAAWPDIGSTRGNNQ